jgi:hypothetical protein
MTGGKDSGSSDSGVDGAAQCPNDLPGSCPATMPSYMSDIAPLLQQKCVPCHSSKGIEASRPLDTYAGVYSLRETVLNQIYHCMMPPVGQPQLDPAQRLELMTWLVCQAPNN